MKGRLGGLRMAALGGGAAVSGGACFHSSRRPAPVPPPITVQILNHAFADMDVYVVQSPGSSSAMRMATVSGFAKSTVTVRVAQLQPGNVLQIELHAIGSRTVWYSSQLAVSPGEHVMLEINADGNGNMSRTLLYPLPDPDGGTAPTP